MKSNLLSFFLVFTGCAAFAQTEVYFKYDEAGNQRYRGDNQYAKPAKEEEPILGLAAENKTAAADQFWSTVQIYPVPVQDMLTISWTDEADQLIDNVTLYQHNTVANVFSRKNLPNLNRKVQVNMNGMYMGVYILSFQLKDGRKMSRNIIKL